MRRRLVLLVVGMTTLVVLAFAIPVAVSIRLAVTQRAEQATTDQADNVAVFLRSGAPTDADVARYATSLSKNTGRPTSVLLPDGTQVGDAAANPGQQAPPAGKSDGPAGGQGPDGTPRSNLHRGPGGQIAEVSVTTGRGRYQVSVFASDKVLHSGQDGWYALLIGGSLGLLLLGFLAAELLTRRIVAPLTATAQTARLLSTGDTDARAPTDGPREIAEVGAAMNALANRIDELIVEERETVADLSHRLRTPLTALRLDAEALASADESERISGLVNELERTLTAVIRAARRPQREGRIPGCDATSVVSERVEFWSALAEDQNRSLAVRLPDRPLVVRASAEDLGAAVDALLENVIAHTAEGVAFSVSVTPIDGGAVVEVADQGTGFADLQTSRGRSDRGSSGLGLDIARRCAEASGGELTVANHASGGASVTLTLKNGASPTAI